MITAAKLAVVITVMLSFPSSAFQASSIRSSKLMKPRTTTQLELFGNAMKNAFSNDDSLGKRDDAGLKKVRWNYHRNWIHSWILLDEYLLTHCQTGSCQRDRTSATSPSTANQWKRSLGKKSAKLWRHPVWKWRIGKLTFLKYPSIYEYITSC